MAANNAKNTANSAKNEEKSGISYKKGSKYIVKRPYVGADGVFLPGIGYELTESQFKAFSAAGEIKGEL